MLVQSIHLAAQRENKYKFILYIGTCFVVVFIFSVFLSHLLCHLHKFLHGTQKSNYFWRVLRTKYLIAAK